MMIDWHILNTRREILRKTINKEGRQDFGIFIIIVVVMMGCVLHGRRLGNKDKDTRGLYEEKKRRRKRIHRAFGYESKVHCINGMDRYWRIYFIGCLVLGFGATQVHVEMTIRTVTDDTSLEPLRDVCVDMKQKKRRKTLCASNVHCGMLLLSAPADLAFFFVSQQE